MEAFEPQKGLQVAVGRRVFGGDGQQVEGHAGLVHHQRGFKHRNQVLHLVVQAVDLGSKKKKEEKEDRGGERRRRTKMNGVG